MIHLERTPRIHRRARSDRMARSPRGELRGFQIGPRIRIGGTLGHIGQQLKIGVGKADKFAAPIVSMMPGIGPVLGAALNIAGNAYDTSNGGLHLKNLPQLALSTGMLYGGGKLGQAVASKIPGLSSIYGGGGGEAGGDAAGGSSWWDKAKNLVGDLGQYFGGGGSGGGGSSLIDKGLLAAGIADQAAQRKRAQDLQKKGLQFATDAYGARQPIRAQGLAMLQHQSTPDVSWMANPANQYSRPTPEIAPAVPITPVKTPGGTY